MLDRIISIPSPQQDDAALARQQALLAQQALDDQLALGIHQHHGKGGGPRPRQVRPLSLVLHPHAPKKQMKQVARQLAQTLPSQLPVHHHGGHRLILMMGRLANTHPQQATAILRALHTLSPQQLTSLLQTLSALPKSAAQSMLSIITQLPPNMASLLITTLASLPPGILAHLLTVLHQGDLDALHHLLADLPDDTAQMLTQLFDTLQPTRDPRQSDDTPNDDEEARQRLQDGWARWAALLNDLYPSPPP